MSAATRIDSTVEPSADDWAPGRGSHARRRPLDGVGDAHRGRSKPTGSWSGVLSGTPFPAECRRLLADAQRAGVAELLRQRLGELPADERFVNVEMVWRAVAASAPTDR